MTNVGSENKAFIGKQFNLYPFGNAEEILMLSSAISHIAFIFIIRDRNINCSALLWITLDGPPLSGQSIHEAGAQVAVINPAQVRDYAKSLAVRSKNDRKDSLVLARFGSTQPWRTWHPEAPEIRELRALLARLEAVVTRCFEVMCCLQRWSSVSFYLCWSLFRPCYWTLGWLYPLRFP